MMTSSKTLLRDNWFCTAQDGNHEAAVRTELGSKLHQARTAACLSKIQIHGRLTKKPHKEIPCAPNMLALGTSRLAASFVKISIEMSSTDRPSAALVYRLA